MKVLLDLLPGTPGLDALRRTGMSLVDHGQDARIDYCSDLEARLADRDDAPWVVVCSPAEVRAAAALQARLWLRGYEAGGVVSETSALILMRAAQGTTFVVEGLGTRAMAASVAIGAAGIVLGAHELLRDNPNPSRYDVQHALAGNLCRCTGYEPIIDAVLEAAGEVRS